MKDEDFYTALAALENKERIEYEIRKRTYKRNRRDFDAPGQYDIPECDIASRTDARRNKRVTDEE